MHTVEQSIERASAAVNPAAKFQRFERTRCRSLSKYFQEYYGTPSNTQIGDRHLPLKDVRAAQPVKV